MLLMLSWLPVHIFPFPAYPWLQMQMLDPSIVLQTAFLLHNWVFFAQSSTFNSEIKEQETKHINADTDYPAPAANSHFTSFHSTSLFVNWFRMNAIEVSPLQKVEMVTFMITCDQKKKKIARSQVTIMKAISYNFEVG